MRHRDGHGHEGHGGGHGAGRGAAGSHGGMRQQGARGGSASYPDTWQRDRAPSPDAGHGLHGPRMATGGETDIAPPFTTAYKVRGVAAILAGADSPVYTVYWPVSGIVREVSGSVVGVACDSAMGGIGVSITVMDGREDILKSAGAAGSAGADFNLYASLFGYMGDRRLYLQRPVYCTLSWQVRFHNYSGSTYTPDLTFFLDEDPHGVRRVQFRKIMVPVGTEIAVYGGPGKRRIIVAE